MRSSRRTFLNAQIAETNRLIELAGDHPLMAPNLRQRKEELECELRSLPASEELPRAVLFFTGQPVVGAVGIDAEFAAKVLQPFLDMVKVQYTASKHGAVGSRGPVRDASEAKLLLTGLPRGSFGLELTPPESSDLFAGKHLSTTLVRLTEVIRSAGESDEEFATAMDDVSPRVLTRLKEFFSVMAEHQADLRLVSGDLECRLDRQRNAAAADRVSNTRTDEATIDKAGIFRGATLDSWRFDFRPVDEDTISGRIGDEVDNERLLQLCRDYMNQRCVARLKRTTVTTRSGTTRTRYELLDLTSVERD